MQNDGELCCCSSHLPGSLSTCIIKQSPPTYPLMLKTPSDSSHKNASRHSHKIRPPKTATTMLQQLWLPLSGLECKRHVRMCTHKNFHSLPARAVEFQRPCLVGGAEKWPRGFKFSIQLKFISHKSKPARAPFRSPSFLGLLMFFKCS